MGEFVRLINLETGDVLLRDRYRPFKESCPNGYHLAHNVSEEDWIAALHSAQARVEAALAQRCAALEALLFDTPIVVIDKRAARLSGEIELVEYCNRLSAWKARYDDLMKDRTNA